MRNIKELVIHCTATKPKWRDGQKTSTKVKEITRWHVEDNGWSDIGYHYVIDRDGTLANGRPLSRIGAHVKGHNKFTIGVSLIGGFGGAATDKFEDHFTKDQNLALRKLIKSLELQFGDLVISGHNEYAAKGCPSFTVADWYGPQKVVVAKPKDSPSWWEVLLSLFTGGQKRDQ